MFEQRPADPVGLVQVGIDVVGGALRGAGEQGVGQHDGVVVDVDDAALRRNRLGDFVGVVGGGQAGADVEELADPGLADEMADGAAQEGRSARAESTMSGMRASMWSPTALSA
jgi:hypothetical protein